MDPVTKTVHHLFKNWYSNDYEQITQLQQSGSDRIYFRIYAGDESYIATYNLNIKENKTFIHFSTHFKNLGLPVPEIYAVNNNYTAYIQQDLGTESLLNQLERFGYTDLVYDLFCKSLEQLARIQIIGHDGLNYEWCLTAKEFGKQAILSDLLYFKYYFLDTLKLPYDKQAMLDDFDALSIYLTKTEYKYFMFRDFQSRNIIVKDGKVSFIDYQGGMHGALQYDVASLLWQAKAELSDDWKDRLLSFYIDTIDELVEKPIDRQTFTSQYNGYTLIRLLQVLGAYGFRGLFERKAHFLTSIPLALTNLKWFVENKHTGLALPEFDRILNIIVTDEIINRFQPLWANESTPLIVKINSFSYRQGIPADESGNGGGFVFDCRGILNPGRFDVYKTLTGNDKSVVDFLEQQTKMSEFLNSVFNIADISVEDYIKRGFSSLVINFGCTGGQHRSVYAAEQLARHLKNKYKVKIEVQHLNKDNWVKQYIENQNEHVQ
jgi:aminoglycoside/choline kinase family phosphotransferase